MTVAATPAATPAPPAAEVEAGLATRALAFAADVVVIDAIGLVVGGILAIIVSLFDPSHPTTKVLIAGGAFVGLIWAACYFAFFWSTSGETPGNRLMRIRVRRAGRDAPLPIPRALLRFAGMILSALLLFLGFALILVDRRRRGLHDLIAGSVVVYVPREPGLGREGRRVDQVAL